MHDTPGPRLRPIIIRGARTHNLKNVDVTLAPRRLTVVTGVSGSGKSSLAFDTVYAEGQRRYVESLSAYARQFLERMERPDVDHVEGIPPAIAIRQKNAVRNPRSTVGTTTEIHDYLRLLFARVGRTICRKCGRDVMRETAESVAERLAAMPEGTRLLLGFEMPIMAAAAASLARLDLESLDSNEDEVSEVETGDGDGERDGDGGRAGEGRAAEDRAAKAAAKKAGAKDAKGAKSANAKNGKNGSARALEAGLRANADSPDPIRNTLDVLRRKGFARVLIDGRDDQSRRPRSGAARQPPDARSDRRPHQDRSRHSRPSHRFDRDRVSRRRRRRVRDRAAGLGR